jgi:hypothetical protein
MKNNFVRIPLDLALSIENTLSRLLIENAEAKFRFGVKEAQYELLSWIRRVHPDVAAKIDARSQS